MYFPYFLLHTFKSLIRAKHGLHIPLSETTGKHSEFMWIEICSIIQEISIPMFSLCDKNITNDT